MSVLAGERDLLLTFMLRLLRLPHGIISRFLPR